MRSVVTGGTGFIGSHLCERLLGLGHQVIAVDSGEIGGHDRLVAGCQLMDRDITHLGIDDWIELFQETDYVFHLAAKKYNSPGVEPIDVFQTNVVATHSIAQAAALSSVRKLVFTSSLYAYGATGPYPMTEEDACRPNTLYGTSKLAGEGIIRSVARETGLRANCARLFFIYGPGQFGDGGYKSVIVGNFERLRAGNRPTVCGDGTQSLDYVYVADCVDALTTLALSEQCGLVVNVASGQAADINHLTQLMIKVSSTSLTPLYVDPDWTQGTTRVGDPSLFERSLGWRASTPLSLGLAQVWAEMDGTRKVGASSAS
jgi:UDP-glucose 4-epimerase